MVRLILSVPIAKPRRSVKSVSNILSLIITWIMGPLVIGGLLGSRGSRKGCVGGSKPDRRYTCLGSGDTCTWSLSEHVTGTCKPLVNTKAGVRELAWVPGEPLLKECRGRIKAKEMGFWGGGKARVGKVME